MRRLLLVATAILVCSAGPAAAAPLTWTAPVHLDRLKPFGSSGRVVRVSCPGTNLCVAIGGSDGYATVSTNPASDSPTWSIPQPVGDDGRAPFDISCPSASFCVAVTSNGEVRTSANPGAESPVWTTTTVPFPAGNVGNGNLQQLSCPTTSFCVANDITGYMYASNNPGAASPTWVATASPVSVGPLACASSGLCVTSTDNTGSVRISTNPGAATPVWSAPVDITPDDKEIDAISCPTVTFCLAGSRDGVAYRSVNPTAASPVWTEITTTSGFHVRDVSCPTPNMCTAIGNSGAITSTNPGAATPVWRARALVPLQSVSCGTASFCLTSDFSDSGGYVTRDASQPSPSPNWSQTGDILGTNTLSAAACPGESLCLAGDDGGRILTTTNPTALGPTWRSTVPPGFGGPIVSVECPATSLCVAAAKKHAVVVSHDPAAATPHWAVTQTAIPFNPKDLSCPTVDRCVAIDGSDQAAVLDDVNKIGNVDDPAPVWRDAKQVDGATGLQALSCPTATHCAAVDSSGGGPLTTTDVTAADPAWNRAAKPSPFGLSDISCPSVDLCVASDGFFGKVIWSTNPFAATPVWNGPIHAGTALTCSSTTFCVAGFANSVRTSTAPGAWSAPVSVMSKFATITSVACAGDRLCLAGSNVGDVSFGVAVPQNRTIPIVTGTAAVGHTLTAAGGTWTGVPATTRQWVRCNAAGGKCAAIGGATGSRYRVSAADVGRRLRVVEIARNAGGRATAASAETAVVPAVMTKALLRKALRARFTFKFTTPVAGTLVVRWHSIKTKKKKKAILLATGRRKFTKPGAGRIKMKLTSKGKRILRKGKKVKVLVTATFRPRGAKAITVSRKLTVKR